MRILVLWEASTVCAGTSQGTAARAGSEAHENGGLSSRDILRLVRELGHGAIGGDERVGDHQRICLSAPLWAVQLRGRAALRCLLTRML